MIKLCDVNKKFGSKEVFKNFSLEINLGDFVLISGVSGCGKTTLLNMIGGIEKPDSGIVEIDGKDVFDKRNQLIFFRDIIGFLFQNFALVENKTVRQNLSLIDKKARTNITLEEALKKVGLENVIDNKVYTLSGGEQQRVALARLMIKRCDYILADEPTGSLDRDNAERVLDILESMNKEGKTVIVVSHDEEIKKRGYRIVCL